MSVPLYDAAIMLAALILLIITVVFNMAAWGDPAPFGTERSIVDKRKVEEYIFKALMSRGGIDRARAA